MSHYSRIAPDRLASTPLGALEITSFAGHAANDNGDADSSSTHRKRAGFGLPAAAFFTGLGAAAVVAAAGQIFGLS